MFHHSPKIRSNVRPRVDGIPKKILPAPHSSAPLFARTTPETKTREKLINVHPPNQRCLFKNLLVFSMFHPPVKVAERSFVAETLGYQLVSNIFSHQLCPPVGSCEGRKWATSCQPPARRKVRVGVVSENIPLAFILYMS